MASQFIMVVAHRQHRAHTLKVRRAHSILTLGHAEQKNSQKSKNFHYSKIFEVVYELMLVKSDGISAVTLTLLIQSMHICEDITYHTNKALKYQINVT